MSTMKHLLKFITLTLVSYASVFAQKEDSLICNRVFSYAFEHKLAARPINEVVAEIGKQFLGSPYEAHTLDGPPPEKLVTNLHSFDCVTFIENALALARSVKNDHLTFRAYSDELSGIRYRGASAPEYTARLHYFTEWIRENERKGFVQDISQYNGGGELTKTINFMTQHRKSYPQLAADSLAGRMRSIEERLSNLKLYVIPTKDIHAASKSFRDGDIIAIATSVPGLDVTHTGIAVRNTDGEVHLMHAPDAGGKIHITDEPLWKYVAKNSKNSGIIVARAVDISN